MKSSPDWGRLQQLSRLYRLHLGGVHRRNRLGERPGMGTGSSIEFQEHRTYQPGDDLRRLDWAAYARSGQMVIRLERQEVMPQLDLVVDLSRSMWDLTDEKRKLFEEVMVMILMLAQGNGLDVRCLLAGDDFRVMRNPSPSEWMEGYAAAAGEGRRTLLNHLDLLAETRRVHASQLWISDLLFDHDPLAMTLRIASPGSSWAVVQVLDQREIAPAPEEACLLESCEDGTHLDLNLDEATVEAYRKSFEAHRDLWNEKTLSHGGIFISMTTLQSLEQSMLIQWTSAGLIEPR